MPPPPPPTLARTTMRPAILLFGDSITQFGYGESGSAGWASLLSSAYQRRADVLNRGYSGYNTRHALDVLPSVLSSAGFGVGDGGGGGDDGDGDGEFRGRRTLFCTVFFGANDAALPGTRQHVPVEEYGVNVREIVRRIRESVEPKGEGGEDLRVPIILITPTPVDEEEWDKWCREMGRDKSQRTNAASRRYGSELKSVGSELGCPVLDVHSLLGGDGDGGGEQGYGRYLTDGLHLTGGGNEALYGGLMDLIGGEFPHLAPMEYDDDRPGPIGVPMEEKLWTELC